MPCNGEKLALAVAAAGGALPVSLSSARAEAEPNFKVPPLGYSLDAIEHHFDAITMMPHYDRHFGAFVEAMNRLNEKSPKARRRSASLT
jgi:iron/manganese superoxide dismutase-like protein